MQAGGWRAQSPVIFKGNEICMCEKERKWGERILEELPVANLYTHSQILFIPTQLCVEALGTGRWKAGGGGSRSQFLYGAET